MIRYQTSCCQRGTPRSFLPSSPEGHGSRPSTHWRRRARSRRWRPLGACGCRALRARCADRRRGAFDRETGEPVPASRLRTYRGGTGPIPPPPRGEFPRRDYLIRDRRDQRHVRPLGPIDNIGKEANRWEEQFYLGANPERRIGDRQMTVRSASIGPRSSRTGPRARSAGHRRPRRGGGRRRINGHEKPRNSHRGDASGDRSGDRGAAYAGTTASVSSRSGSSL